MEIVADVPAEDGADNRGRQGRHGPKPVGGHCLFTREDAQEQGLRQWHHRAAGESLANAGDDQKSQRVGKTAHGGTDAEAGHGGAKYTHSSETGGQPAGQGDGDGFGNRVGSDDPCTLTGRDAKVAGDAGNGDIGDRHVQHSDEVGA